MSASSARDAAVTRRVAGLVLQYPGDELERDLPILKGPRTAIRV